jgi:hypothetical protein
MGKEGPKGISLGSRYRGWVGMIIGCDAHLVRSFSLSLFGLLSVGRMIYGFIKIGLWLMASAAIHAFIIY